MRTNIVAIPIDKPFMADEVVPSVGHIPRRRTKVGFSLMMPFIKTLKLFMIVSPFLYQFSVVFAFSLLSSCFSSAEYLPFWDVAPEVASAPPAKSWS